MRFNSSTQGQRRELSQALVPGYEAIDRQREAGTDGVARVNRRRRDFLAGLPVLESESVQLGPGTGKYRSRRIGGRDLVVVSYEVTPRMTVHTVLKKDWAMLLMPLNRRAHLVFNGRLAKPFDLFLSAGRDGYMTTGEDRCNVAIVIRKARLISACAALAGVGADDVTLRDRVLPREEHSGPRLYRALCGVATQSCEEPLSEGQFPMPQALENDLISMLAAELVPAVRRVPEVNPFRVDMLRVVRAAIAASKALPAPSLADLCAAAGVSQRWLHKCFVEVLDVSPYRYIRLARLSRARKLLFASESKPALVKGVALSLGYRSSGRFAAEYRSVFGENPSETIQGSRKV